MSGCLEALFGKVVVLLSDRLRKGGTLYMAWAPRGFEMIATGRAA